MPVTIPDRTSTKASLWKRLGWFALFYLVGVAAVGLVAYGLRLWIKS